MWWSRSRPTDTSQEHSYEPDDADTETGKMPLGRHSTICGLRKKVFLFVILGGILIVVTAVAVGIGAGIAVNESPSKPKPKVLDTKSDVTCPSDDDAIIRSDGDYYRVSCGLDYPVSYGAADLDTRDVSSMGKCVKMCAGEEGCMGVAWRDDKCVLKESVGRSKDSGGVVLALEIDKPDNVN